jgi:hypothetical protein
MAEQPALPLTPPPTPDWECPGCGKTYPDPADVPPQCPDCGEYADHDPE